MSEHSRLIDLKYKWAYIYLNVKVWDFLVKFYKAREAGIVILWRKGSTNAARSHRMPHFEKLSLKFCVCFRTKKNFFGIKKMPGLLKGTSVSSVEGFHHCANVFDEYILYFYSTAT